MPNQMTYSALRDLAADWTAAGLDRRSGAPILDAVDRIASIRADLAQFRADAAGGLKAAGNAYATGDATLAEAVARRLASDQTNEARAVASAAEAAIRATAFRALRTNGDTIAGKVGERYAKVWADLAGHVETIGDATTPAEAFAAGGDVTTAWHALDAARPTVLALDAVAGTLADHDTTPGTWSTPPSPHRQRTIPVRALADRIAAGPPTYTSANAAPAAA